MNLKDIKAGDIEFPAFSIKAEINNYGDKNEDRNERISGFNDRRRVSQISKGTRGQQIKQLSQCHRAFETNEGFAPNPSLL